MNRTIKQHCLTWLALNWRFIVLALTPVILLPLPILRHSVESRCAYVILLMIVYWVTEAVPLAVTAFVPVFAFPFFGILSTRDVAMVYLKDTNFVFMGGLIMAVAVEHCNLHKRIALYVIIHVGQSPRLLLAGFMISTVFLSMWISNTAAAAMMLPIVAAVSKELDKALICREGEAVPLCSKGGDMEANVTALSPESWSDEKSRAMKKMLFLGVAFAANIGGTGSPLGCGPNLVAFAVMKSTFGEGTGLNFGTWMLFNIPGMLMCSVLGWCWLQFHCRTGRNGNQSRGSSITQERAIKSSLQQLYRELGSISQHEIVVLSSFIVLVFLLVFRAPGFVGGWAYYITNSFENQVIIRDASPVMFIVFLLFCIPKSFKKDINGSNASGTDSCLTWKVVQEKTPWGIILLLGGGYAMAEGAKVSGLSLWMGHQLRYIEVLPKEAIVFIISLMSAMLTEVASNTATASILLPVIRDLALAINVHPLYLILPAAVCCAYAFMLPLATPGNAIVLTAAGLKISEMIRAGLVMNLICVTTITFMINTLGVIVFDLQTFPDWAVNVTLITT